VEVALDRGRIEAKGERAAVSELEFELKKGHAGDAIALARRWHATHGGWLSTISKAERGQRLARHEQFGPPRMACTPAERARSGREFAKGALHECLEQVLVNASEVSVGSTQAEHVHQLRVGIRRLRTAMRELGALLPDVDPQWDAAWIALFRDLGRARDKRFLEQMQSRLEAAGGPPIEVGSDAEGATDPVAAVRSPAFQDALLAMLALVHGDAFDRVPDTAAKQLKLLLGKSLRKLRKAVLADGSHFDELPADRQHRVRKRAKRLRYLAEFAQGVLRGKEAQDFIAALKPLQDALGDYNDELLALQHYGRHAGLDPHAWFGAGWLGARRPANAIACTEAIRKFADARPFWKR
jgi:inorganic triphosphatase YgiF